MIFIIDMKYAFLIIFLLIGCAHRKGSVEEPVNSDRLDLLIEEDLEELPESKMDEDTGNLGEN